MDSYYKKRLNIECVLGRANQHIFRSLHSSYFKSEDVFLERKDGKLVDFSDFGLSEEMLRGLLHAGFENPSPIQLKAIPIGIIGHDMLMQAKSGTGKTCVCSLIALERVILSLNRIQVLVVCPCREIAIQTNDVLKCLGKFKKGLKVGLFIGGCALSENLRQMAECQIVVGTPGRLAHLIREFGMDLSSVQISVLDEADKLFEDSFSGDLPLIAQNVPCTAQFLAVSATFEDGIEKQVSLLLKNPVKIQLDVADLSLIGVKQYGMDVRKVYGFSPEQGQSVKLEEMVQLKLRSLLEALRTIPYAQAIVFSAYQLKAERIYDHLLRHGVDAVLLSGTMSQPLRLEVYRTFKKEKADVLVTTDLSSRGLDYERVNLVINYESPLDLATYIHRMGRSGRFGSWGRVLTLIGFGADAAMLAKFQMKANLNISVLQSLEELKDMAAAPPPTFDDLRCERGMRLGSNLPPIGPHLLTFGEILDYLCNGGEEAYEFAVSYSTKINMEQEIDPEYPTKLLGQLLSAKEACREII